MTTYAFVDAANLFYGGEKSLGWKIDYQKLIKYLNSKYEVSRVLYFGGIEIYDFPFDYLRNDNVPLRKLLGYLKNKPQKLGDYYQDKDTKNNLQRTKFYLKLEDFGYELYLKPVKIYRQDNGVLKRKANCDVDMTFWLMREKEKFNRVVILSGDGDFLPVLKYLKRKNKNIFILARGERTAREIRQFAAGNFRDFGRLKNVIEFKK